MCSSSNDLCDELDGDDSSSSDGEQTVSWIQNNLCKLEEGEENPLVEVAKCLLANETHGDKLKAIFGLDSNSSADEIHNRLTAGVNSFIDCFRDDDSVDSSDDLSTGSDDLSEEPVDSSCCVINDVPDYSTDDESDSECNAKCDEEIKELVSKYESLFEASAGINPYPSVRSTTDNYVIFLELVAFMFYQLGRYKERIPELPERYHQEQLDMLEWLRKAISDDAENIDEYMEDDKNVLDRLIYHYDYIYPWIHGFVHSDGKDLISDRLLPWHLENYSQEGPRKEELMASVVKLKTVRTEVNIYGRSDN